MNTSNTIKATLDKAVHQLDNDEAKLEAQLLLGHTLHANHAWLITHAQDIIPPEKYRLFNTLIQRRIDGEPIAYILGEREFYGLSFKVTSDTLIPRPDTETLVEVALAKIPSHLRTYILDLGTGSGAIALAIAKYHPEAQVTAVDFSEAALAVAKENAAYLNIPNVRFIESNWFDALQNQTFDLIVSNPPYIEENDAHLSQGDLRYEPLSALVAGKDGLDDIRQIIEQAHTHLNANGWLLLEHGYNQAALISILLASAHFLNIETIKDLGGNDRVTLGRKV